MRRRRAPDDPATAYARAVVAGEILAGRLVHLACERHLRDLDRDDLAWDAAAAARAIKFFPDVLRLNGGEFEGRPFEPSPWQAFIIGSLFGWKGADGYRRFRVAYCEIAKGNGKSPLAAGIGHYLLLADGEPRAEVYAAATKKDQAMILFRDAVAMWSQSPRLKARLVKSGSEPDKVWNLADPKTGSFFRPISSDDGQSGPRPHGGLIDELHEHKSSLVVEMMRAGTKGRRQALIFEITNAGWDRTTVCWAHHQYSEKVLTGAIEADSWFAYIATLDEGDDWTDEAVWPKANPNLGVSVTLKYLREQVAEAKGMPTKENIVRRLNFTQWTEQEEIWLPSDLWQACAEPTLTAESLHGRECFAGLDLSESEDITALGLVFPPREEGEPLKVLEYYWVPSDNVARRAQEARIPYDLWVERGLLEATPGSIVDYDFIRRRINELRDRYEWNVREVPFDPHGALQLATQLAGDGFVTVRINQSIDFYDPVMTCFEGEVKARRIAHSGHPITTWMMSNVAPQVDARGKKRPDKRRSREKIDGVSAILMARGRAMVAAANPASVYEERGILTV